MSTPISTPPTFNPENRLTFRLLSYWNRIKAGRSMPSLADVNIQEIAEMWHFTFTIDVRNQQFHYFGPELATIFKTDYTGEYVGQSMQDDPILGNTIGFYPKVIERRAPLSESSSFHLNGREVRYRSLIVPLSSDGLVIDYVLGTTNYKVV